MSLLFAPHVLRGATARNRIWVAPRCQYSATDRLPDDRHLVHPVARAVGGAGVVLTEAAAAELGADVSWPAQYDRARPVPRA